MSFLLHRFWTFHGYKQPSLRCLSTVTMSPVLTQFEVKFGVEAARKLVEEDKPAKVVAEELNALVPLDKLQPFLIESLKTHRDTESLKTCLHISHLGTLQGDKACQYTYATMMLRGLGTTASSKDAAVQFKDLARHGHGESIFQLAGMYLTGNGVKHDERRAFELYKVAAGRGIAPSFFTLGDMLLQHRGPVISNDHDELALLYFDAGSLAGDPRSMVAYAGLLSKLRKKDQNIAIKVKSLYQNAAEKGYALGHYNLANCYFTAQGTTKDLGKAFNHLEMAAKSGFVLAQVELGIRLFQGMEIKKNQVEGEKWLETAAEKGNEDAQQFLDRVKNGDFTDSEP